MKKKVITIGIAAMAACVGTMNAQNFYFPTVSVINNSDPAFTFSVDPGSPSQSCIQYQWNFGDGNTLVTPTPTVSHTYSTNGNYNVMVCPYDSCDATATYSCDVVSVSVNNASNPTFTCSASLSVYADSLASPGNYVYYYYYSPTNATPIAYNWLVISSSYSTTATGSSPVFNLPPGTYSICLQIVLLNQAGTDTCSQWTCASVSDSVNNISVYKLGTTGIVNHSNFTTEVVIYPNPARETLNLRFNAILNTEINIMDISGRVVKKTYLNGNNLNINISDLQSGIYYINIKDNDNNISKKFIKE
ncbi:MAG: hypothetical protein Fur0023_17970 [Bacteroidia bacterium]